MKNFKSYIIRLTTLILALIMFFTVLNITSVSGETNTSEESPSVAEETAVDPTPEPTPTLEETVPPTTEPIVTEAPTTAPTEKPSPTVAPTTAKPVTSAPTVTTPAPAVSTPAASTPAATTPAAKTPSPTPTPTPAPTLKETPPPVPPSINPTIPVSTTSKPEVTSVNIVAGMNVEMKKNLRGYVFRIAGWWDEVKSNSRIKNKIEEIEKKYNCQILFMDLTQQEIWDGLLKSKATGKPFADAVFLEADSVLGKMMPLNLLAPINRFYTEDEIKAIPESYLRALSVGGNLYAVPAKIPNFNGLWVNVDILNASKIPSIFDLYRNGDWTWEQFDDVMFNTTLDRDNTKVTDLYGISVGIDIYPGLVASSGANIIQWDGTKFTSGIQNGRVVSAFNFAQTIYKQRYVGNDGEKHFYRLFSGMMTGETWMVRKIKEYVHSNLLFVPYPVSVKGEQYTALATSAPVIALVESGLYKAETAQIIKELYNADTFNDEKKSFMKNFSKESEQVYENMLKNFTFDYTKAFFDDYSLRNSLVSEILNGTINEQVINEKYASLIEKAIQIRNKPVKLSRLPVEMSW